MTTTLRRSATLAARAAACAGRTAGALLLLGGALLADTITLVPVADNTLYLSETGHLSNGSGVHIFAGLTSIDSLRRCLLRFDVAGSLPPGATITAVELRMLVSKTSTTVPKAVSLHRALAAWGEGASDAGGEEGEGAFTEPGDATWLHRFHPSTFWAAPGGDFEPTPSATVNIGFVGAYAWTSTAALVADVQGWLDGPAANHGWLVKGTESGVQNAKRFNSRENSDPSSRPMLVIEFTAPATCTGAWTEAGAGLAGAGGAVPALAGTGCPEPGGSITLDVVNGLGGATCVLFAGLAPATTSFKGGTFFVGNIILNLPLPLGGTPGAAGAGALSLPALLPAQPALQGLQLHLQAALQDVAAVQGISLSNGLRMDIG